MADPATPGTVVALAASRGLPPRMVTHLAVLAAESAGAGPPPAVGRDGALVIEGDASPGVPTPPPAGTNTTTTTTRSSMTLRSQTAPPRPPPGSWPLALILPDPLIDEATSVAAAAEVQAALAAWGGPGRLAGAARSGDVDANVRGDTAMWVSSAAGAVPLEEAIAETRDVAGLPRAAEALAVFLPAAVDALVSHGVIAPTAVPTLLVSVQATLYAAGSAGYGRHIDHGRAASVAGRIASAALYLGPRARPPGAGGELEVWPGTGMGAKKRRRSNTPTTTPPAPVVSIGPSLLITPQGGRAVAWDARMMHAVRPVSADAAGAPPRLALSVFFLRGGGEQVRASPRGQRG